MGTILIVEDSRLLLQMISTMIRSKGFEVIEAHDGSEALKIADGRRIDMVLTDLIMPGMDGFELTRKIRANETYKHVPILMITTQSDSKVRREGKDAGVTGWVLKPFTSDTLIPLIKKIRANF
jgi:two-component system, chemotaxis family, chemotaxis protein CheY